MSKRYIGGTVRFDNQRKTRPVAAGMFPNWETCQYCNRMVPTNAYHEHAREHFKIILGAQPDFKFNAEITCTDSHTRSMAWNYTDEARLVKWIEHTLTALCQTLAERTQP